MARYAQPSSIAALASRFGLGAINGTRSGNLGLRQSWAVTSTGFPLLASARAGNGPCFPIHPHCSHFQALNRPRRGARTADQTCRSQRDARHSAHHDTNDTKVGDARHWHDTDASQGGLPPLTEKINHSVHRGCYMREAAMYSSVKKRSVVIASHKTSISLEDKFWSCLQQIARERATTLSKLIGMLNAERNGGNLSSAIRVFVLNHYRNSVAPAGSTLASLPTASATGLEGAAEPTVR